MVNPANRPGQRADPVLLFAKCSPFRKPTSRRRQFHRCKATVPRPPWRNRGLPAGSLRPDCGSSGSFGIGCGRALLKPLGDRQGAGNQGASQQVHPRLEPYVTPSSRSTIRPGQTAMQHGRDDENDTNVTAGASGLSNREITCASEGQGGKSPAIFATVAGQRLIR
jgi:hypothetical protein